MLTIDDLSVQLYTVREAAAVDLDAVLERLAGIGFRQVEPYGLLDFASQLATSLPRHGLTAPTTHASIVGEDQDVVFGTAADLGIQIVVEPAVRDDRWTDEDAVKRSPTISTPRLRSPPGTGCGSATTITGGSWPRSAMRSDWRCSPATCPRGRAGGRHLLGVHQRG